MVRVVWIASLAAAISGCQLGPTASVTAAFDPKAAQYVLKPGKGRIDGQAFLKRDYGRVVTAAGERVFLIPATAYAVERFEKMFDGGRRSYYGNAVDDPPPEYLTYRRETKVDMTGKFAFEDVAPGRYIVATRVFWTEPKSFLTHGGAMYDLVDVRDEATTTAIVSGR